MRLRLSGDCLRVNCEREYVVRGVCGENVKFEGCENVMPEMKVRAKIVYHFVEK